MYNHKSEDYKLSAVEYYLTEDNHRKKCVKYSNFPRKVCYYGLDAIKKNM